MKLMQFSSAVAAIGAACLGAAVDAAAQRRTTPLAPGQESKVPVTVAIAAGTTQYAFTGQGTCQSTPRASIYNVPAALSSVRVQDGARNVNLTLWQPSNGTPAMISLGITADGKSHRVDTVKVGQQGTTQGSGTATLQKQGSAGTFAVDATAADGTKIKGTIRCPSFVAPVAEGG
jgi:hypothetical protein